MTRHLRRHRPVYDEGGPDIKNAPKDMLQWSGNPGRFPNPKGEIPRAAQVPPFWQIKPPSGIDFFTKMNGVLAAGAGSTLTLTPSPLLRVLPDYKGVVAGVTIFIDTPLATLDITFALRNNAAPVQGWDQLEPFAVAANALIIPFPGTLQIPGNSQLDVLVTNNAASGPWNVGASISGWSWPSIDEDITFGRL